jgi:hypothetical protein
VGYDRATLEALLACREEDGMPALLAISGFLEWFFVLLLVGLVGATGLFAAFVAAQLFRNPGRGGPDRRR